MKKKIVIMACIAINVPTQNTKAQSRFGVSEIRISSGRMLERYPMFNDINIARTLSGNSTLLSSSNLADYTASGYNYGKLNGSQFSLELGLKNKMKKNPVLWQIGIRNSSALWTGNNFTKTNTYRVDTLKSQTTNAQVFIDSVVRDYIYTSYNASEFTIDAGVQYRTNPALRWSLFGGVKIAAGKMYNSATRVLHNRVSSSSAPIQNSESFTSYNNYSLVASENKSNQNGNSMSISAPIGVDFRMGKRREFWKKLHLFTEMRPGILRRNLQNNVAPYITSFSQFGGGIKVAW